MCVYQLNYMDKDEQFIRTLWIRLYSENFNLNTIELASNWGNLSTLYKDILKWKLLKMATKPKMNLIGCVG